MLLRGACALVLMVIGFAVVANAQTEKTFPTDAEINLVLTQTERAIQQGMSRRLLKLSGGSVDVPHYATFSSAMTRPIC
jgi:hypothetical protein